MTPKTMDALEDVLSECERQERRWGTQDHPNGTGPSTPNDWGLISAEEAKYEYELRAKHGTVTWVSILLEEVLEAFEESDPKRLREELVQVAAVATSWIAAIDRAAKGK